MSERDKLAELLADYYGVDPAYYGVDAYGIADHFLANGVTFQKWIPVSERLPKPNKLVLCWWRSGDGEREHYGFATFQSHGVWYVSNEGMPEVTHWMPLPEPPKED